MKLLSPLRRILTRPPRGMQTGRDVTIHRPHRISHPECIRIGDRTLIHHNALIAPIVEYAGIRHQPRVTIGSDVYIGPGLFLACIGRVTIGDGCTLSESVFLNDSNHGLDPEAGLIMQQPLVHGGDITIGNHCFLALRSAILPGVTLGDHCVVGINSVVTQSFPAYSMLSGSPARLIATWDHDRHAWV